jgi:DNA-directed RNA polymerase subunit beta
VFPIVSYSGNAALEYVDYRLGTPAFDVKECVLRGITYSAPLRVKVRLIIYDKESPSKAVKEVKEQEVYMGEIPLMTQNGTFVINGTERVVVSQLHRSPGVFFDHDRGKTHSSASCCSRPRDPLPRLLARLRVRPGPRLRAHRPAPQAPATILLRLEFSSEQVSTCSSRRTSSTSRRTASIDLIPERMRGDVSTFEIGDKKGDILVEVGRNHRPACATARTERTASTCRAST